MLYAFVGASASATPAPFVNALRHDKLIGVVGYSLGPAIAGFLYEYSGGYTIPYLAIAASSLIGMTVFSFSGPMRPAAN